MNISILSLSDQEHRFHLQLEADFVLKVYAKTPLIHKTPSIRFEKFNSDTTVIRLSSKMLCMAGACVLLLGC